AKILRDDDVRRLLGPELRDLDVALLEHDLAALGADDGRAQFPFNFVERIDTSLGEKPWERQTWSGGLLRPPLRVLCPGWHRHLRASPVFTRLLAGASGLNGSAIFHTSPAPFTPALPG